MRATLGSKAIPPGPRPSHRGSAAILGTLRLMQPPPGQPRHFDFCFINLDYTLVRVEEFEGNVTIRATADTFSRQRKNCFIRELTAEGFIPDDRWFPPSDPDPSSRGIRWLIDASWVKIDQALIARNHRLVKRFIVPLVLGWLLIVLVARQGQGRTGFSTAGEMAPRVGALGER